MINPVKLKNLFSNKIFLSLLLFFMISIPLIVSIEKTSFFMDDLGHIVKGHVGSWKEFKRVFSEDETVHLTPDNFTRPTRNILNSYYRPLQSIPFSIVYKIFGANPYAFYNMLVIANTLTIVLFFILLLQFLPLLFSFFGAISLALISIVPYMLISSATLHVFMYLFFFLSSIFFYYIYIKQKKSFWHLIAAGLSFFLALLSRETSIPTPVIFFLGTYLLATKNKSLFWAKITYALQKTWIFFAFALLYTMLKIIIFGFEGIGLTIQRMITEKIIPLIPTLFTKITHLKDLLLSPKALFLYIVIIIISSALFYLYKGRYKILFFLLFSIVITSWPFIIIPIPNHHYLHLMFPFGIFLIFYSLHLLIKKFPNMKNTIIALTTIAIILLSLKIAPKNLIEMRKCGNQTWENFNHKYQPIKEQLSPEENHIIVFNSGIEPDFESTMQVVTNNPQLKVSFIFVALQSGVHSEITPIKNGYRLTSLTPEKTGWFFHRQLPIRWSEKQNAYPRYHKPYEQNKWYKFSMGKFIIHKMNKDKDAIDFSLIFDKKLIDKKTAFFVWDTLKRKYVKIDSGHFHE